MRRLYRVAKPKKMYLEKCRMRCSSGQIGLAKRHCLDDILFSPRPGPGAPHITQVARARAHLGFSWARRACKPGASMALQLDSLPHEGLPLSGDRLTNFRPFRTPLCSVALHTAAFGCSRHYCTQSNVNNVSQLDTIPASNETPTP